MKKKGGFEAEKKIQRTALTRVAVLSFFLFAACGHVGARELPQAVTALLERLGESGARATEDLAEHLCSLMEAPMDINTATEEELRGILLLSTFQIASLLEYREVNGAVLSPGELSLVDGFNEVTVETLGPFIRYGEALPQAGKKKKAGTEVRGRYAYPDYGYLRYRGTYGERLRWGVTAEQDAGERAAVPDFLSAHLAIYDLALSRNINVRRCLFGDFSVRLGQGLTAWNGFSLGGLGDPSSVVRYPDGISPYTSSDELDFCRGVGVKAAFGRRVEATVFFSDHAVDARCDSVWFYTLPDDGKHDTESLAESRHGMREMMVGGSVVWRTSRFKAGLNGVAYSYDRLDGRKSYPYNEYQRYDGWWGDFSADCLVPVRIGRVHGRLFGEAAFDADLHTAVLGGGTFAFLSSLECSLTARYYQPGYIAPHAGAYTASSGCFNEHGLLLNVRWNALRRLTLTGLADAACHPAERYRIPAGSRTLKVRGAGQWRVSSVHSLEFQAGAYLKSYMEDVKYDGRVTYRYGGASGLVCSSRAEVSVMGEPGYLLYQELGYAAPSGGWNLYLRGTAFHVDDWDNRIYCYERDLYGTFSVPALYGRGLGVYLFGTVKPLPWLKLSLKSSWTHYPSEQERDRFTLKFMFSMRF